MEADLLVKTDLLGYLRSKTRNDILLLTKEETDVVCSSHDRGDILNALMDLKLGLPLKINEPDVDSEKNRLWTNIVEYSHGMNTVFCKEDLDVLSLSKVINWFLFKGKRSPVLNIKKSEWNSMDLLSSYWSEEARSHGQNIFMSHSMADLWKEELRYLYEVVLKRDDVVLSSEHFKNIMWYIGYEVSTFKPTNAKFIFEFFQSKRVLDPYGGWGDRMIGAAAACEAGKLNSTPAVQEYTCCSPNTLMKVPFQKLTEFLSERSDIKLEHMIIPFRYAKVKKNYYDMVFFEPPRIDREHFPTDIEQTIGPNETQAAWFADFVIPTVEKLWDCLELNGYLVFISRSGKNDPHAEPLTMYIAGWLGEFMGMIYMNQEESKTRKNKIHYPFHCFQKKKNYSWEVGTKYRLAFNYHYKAIAQEIRKHTP
ncbi:hypothetical protein [Salmon gill poxvirus]|nr:hypothetical protein [Salmon gill poxvirus]